MNQNPTLIDSPEQLRAMAKVQRSKDHKIALVPTMGALHEGHLALVRQARSLAQTVIVSIFVNPTQFAPNEDFSRYPRTLDRDTELLAGLADVIYVPAVDAMYPKGFATKIVLEGPALGLESDFRPHFFSGVAIVVSKLFLQSGADYALFGEKDYQQLKVVTRLAADLDIPIQIVPGETVRESDGLALSSRNRYLSPDERAIAPVIHQSLVQAAADIRTGTEPGIATERASKAISAAGLRVDYVAARHAEDLSAPTPGVPLRLLAAAWIGGTRLIDNVPV